MLTNLTDLATTLQTLFTADAYDLAHATHFVRRRRKLVENLLDLEYLYMPAA